MEKKAPRLTGDLISAALVVSLFIAPASAQARSMASSEAIVGQIYLAALIA